MKRKKSRRKRHRYFNASGGTRTQTGYRLEAPSDNATPEQKLQYVTELAQIFGWDILKCKRLGSEEYTLISLGKDGITITTTTYRLIHEPFRDILIRFLTQPWPDDNDSPPHWLRRSPSRWPR